MYMQKEKSQKKSASANPKQPIQLKKEGARALKRICLHQMGFDGVEERNSKIMIPAYEPFIIDLERKYIREKDKQPMVYAKYDFHEGCVKNLPDRYWKRLSSPDDNYDAIQSAYKKLEARLSEAGITLKGWDAISNHIIIRSNSGIPIPPAIFEQTFWQIIMTAIPRIKRDLNIIKQNNLITEDATRIIQIELSGGDSHKMGQTPLFVTFNDGKRIVYKPNSLEMDAALFRQGDSAASQLSVQGGQQIPQYNILPLTDNDTQDKYGYMEFIDSTVTPPDGQGKEQIFQIFRSIAANMAFSYLFGLADIHQENFILHNNSLQLIDMEVVTGVYGDTVLQGWKQLLSNYAFTGKVNMSKLTNEDFISLKGEMEESFRAIYNKAATYCIIDDNVRPILNQSSDLRAMQVRFVPFPTRYFYEQITYAENMSYQEWQDYIDQPVPYDPSLPRNEMCLPNFIMTPLTVTTILKAPGTYEALHRGEIPFFTKYTDRPNEIQDENGYTILLPQETAPMFHTTMIPQVDSRWPRQTDPQGELTQQLFQPFWDIVNETFYAICR